jgi:hypothetical protein
MKNKGEILAAILRNYKDCCFFLHNTKDQNIAELIMTEGFLFENQLSHSTDRVDPEETIEVTYFLFQRKDYGPYTIVIALRYDVYDSYTEQSETRQPLEDLLTTSVPYLSDNDELIYRLSGKHVLGYFNNIESDFHFNSQWDPAYCNSYTDLPPEINII